MPNLYLTIGLIGSGKSTWAKKMAQENSNVKIICPDKIREMLNGEYKYEKNLDNIIDLICKESVLHCIGGNYDVIVDCCNLTDKRRNVWLCLYPRYFSDRNISNPITQNVKKIAVIFPNKDRQWHVDNVVKTEKGKLFDRKYWEDVYDLHKSQYEPVNKDDFEEVIYE